MRGLIAATPATAWPSYSAFSRAMMLRLTCQKFTATRSGPIYSNFWSGKSFAVTTALTPGSFSAFEVSIDLIRACACGERRMRPYSMPAIFMSAPYSARPVTLGTPSGRMGRVPTHLKRFTESVMTESFTAPPSLLSVGDCLTGHQGCAAGAQRQARRPHARRSGQGPRRARGVTNCNSVSQGNRIHVSCDTSVTNVSTVSRPAGLA